MGQLAAVSIINEIRDNPFYGSVPFVVQISEWFRQMLGFMNEEEGLVEERNCWLVVKYDRLLLYSISLTRCLFTFDYDDILRIVAYPAAIEVRLRGREVETLKLKTTCSYSIRELLLYYKHYNQMIRKMEEDNDFEASVIELVREHGHPSEHLRHTIAS
jgi:hypothetical protein